ncbi:YrrS family protein [Gracilibacillus massiliensis]|uniref:YrrS family protein n=1 Tax=Gracilibacillus massiliensis TaxID=1564956 RepID=UPI00071E2070|nr:YrrS family protein [Gracilibacillus massiliensis]
MADEFGNITRRDRFEKKRTNTKAITWLSIVGGVLIIVIISLIVFGGNDQDTPVATDDQDNEETEEIQGQDQKNQEETDQPVEAPAEEDLDQPDEIEIPDENDEEEEQESRTEEEEEINEVESDDDNVSYAFEGNWDPIGTEQDDPHTTSFEKESQDWKERMQAIEIATGIPVEEQISWYHGNGGDQTVEATVSPSTNQDVTVKVTLVWIENEGWQPTLVEELIENEYKSNTSSDSSDDTENEQSSSDDQSANQQEE